MSSSDGEALQTNEDAREAMWSEVVGDNPLENWYGPAAEYWERQAATDDGMLGGYARISPADVRGSRSFLAKLGLGEGSDPKRLVHGDVLDCGAGIGRVTGTLLLDACDGCVDLVEQCAAFTARAKETFAGNHRVRHVRTCGLHQVAFTAKAPQADEKNTLPSGYALVWAQWVLLYLTDGDLVAFLRAARAALRPGGVIVCKENVTRFGGGSGNGEDDVDDDQDEDFDVDFDDRSITRSDAHYRDVFRRAGCEVVAWERQQGFPDELFPVHMWALR